MTFRSSMAVCAFAVASILSGCSEPRPEFVPAEGVVRLNGKPERGIVVRLSPDEANPFQAMATGTSDEQGKFKLTYEFKGETGEGAAVGSYKVTLVDSKVGFTPQGARPKPSSIPYLYGDTTKSPLSAEIKAGGPPLEFDVRK